LVSRTKCKGITKGGERCLAPVLTDREFCYFHDPEHEAEAAEARRLGGLRRKRESTLQGAYEITGVGSLDDLLRILEVVTFDALSLDNSIARGRLLLGVVQMGTKLIEVGEHEERLAAIESALGPRLVRKGRR
jgi:hypothetical protein